MKKTLSLVIGIAAVISQGCNSSKNTAMSTDSNAAYGKAEWISLFDGKTTKGWHVFGKTNAGSWKAVDGALYLDTAKVNGKREGGDLVTDQEFENYHLSLEWKVAPGSNSGVIFNVNDDAAKYPATYHTGPEMQVLDNDRHPDAKIIKHRAGDLYDLISSSKETVKPVGEWNQAEIKLNKGKLDLYLNGTNVVSTTMWDDNWKNMVANSKFKTMPGFAAFKKGRIALQDHGDAVWFRNIKIMKL